MPYEKGGRADKKGNKYEINCIVYELLKVLDGSNYSVVIEALGEDEKGTDILVTNHEGKKEHQQCKARNGSSDNWTISDLKARKIFNAWKIQLDRECDRKVALVSPMTCSFLVDLNDKLGNNEIEFIRNHAFEDSENDKEFMKCFLHDITEESDEMFELRMLFYEHYTEYAANDYVDVKTMMLKFEERTLRLLSFWLAKIERYKWIVR